MFIIVIRQGGIEVNPSVVIGSFISRVYIYFFETRQIQKLQLKRVPYNKLLTNLACLSHTEEYWPSAVFVGASLR